MSSNTSTSADLDPPFENRIFTCYSIKIFKEQGTVQILEDKDVKKTFRLSSFPEGMDLNDVKTVSGLIAVVKKEGVEGLRKKYKLKSVRAK